MVAQPAPAWPARPEASDAHPAGFPQQSAQQSIYDNIKSVPAAAVAPLFTDSIVFHAENIKGKFVFSSQ